MFGIDDALLGAAGSVVGNLVGGLFGKSGAKKANEAAVMSAIMQQNFQERMANTAHQRQVVDLRAAGLNPILSAKLGGAAVPPGASFQAQNENIQLGDAIGRSVSSALAARQAVASVEETEARVRNIDSDTALKKAELPGAGFRSQTAEHERDIKAFDRYQKSMEYNLTPEREKALRAEFQAAQLTPKEKAVGIYLLEQQGKISFEDAKKAALEGGLSESQYGTVLRYLERAVQSISPLRLHMGR